MFGVSNCEESQGDGNLRVAQAEQIEWWGLGYNCMNIEFAEENVPERIKLHKGKDISVIIDGLFPAWYACVEKGHIRKTCPIYYKDVEENEEERSSEEDEEKQQKMEDKRSEIIEEKQMKLDTEKRKREAGESTTHTKKKQKNEKKKRKKKTN